jgi:predicted nucleic acid-binding protein
MREEQEKIKVYLDASALNRIFDDQSQARIFLEASSMLIIFSLLEASMIEIITSEVLSFENEKNPFSERHVFVEEVLARAVSKRRLDGNILERARAIEEQGVKGIDALHLACAEASEADYFLTCDDRILKHYSGNVMACNPIQFVLSFMEESDHA